MDITFSAQVDAILKHAEAIATERKEEHVEANHVLEALITSRMGSTIFTMAGFPRTSITEFFNALVTTTSITDSKKSEESSTNQVLEYSPGLKALIEKAEELRLQKDEPHICFEQLLFAFLFSDNALLLKLCSICGSSLKGIKNTFLQMQAGSKLIREDM